MVNIDTDGELWIPGLAFCWKQRQGEDMHNSVCFGRHNLGDGVWTWPSITCLNPGPQVNILATAKEKAIWTGLLSQIANHCSTYGSGSKTQANAYGLQ